MQNKIVKLETVDSTNNYARKRLQTQDVMNGTVIMADYQQLGRGQGSNVWLSEKGKNILASYIWIPEQFPSHRQFYISMALTLAICNVSEAMNLSSLIKWPNDILINHRKVCGILIEHILIGKYIKASVLGFGLNINQTIFDRLSNATSVQIETGQPWDREIILKKIIHSLEDYLKIISKNHYTVIKEEYLEKLYLFRESHLFRTADTSFMGEITDVKDTGELVIIDDKGKVREFMFKEVTFE